MKRIILKHSIKYPLMEVRDYLKLIYQNSFGPKHFTKNPSLENIIYYLKEEFKEFKPSKNTNIIEAIGNDYVRVSLDIINKHDISFEELALAFKRSMDNYLIDINKTKILFNKKVNILIKMIETNKIKLNKTKSINFIKNYLKKGIKPLSHSEVYRQNYHPHYRVVHKKNLKKIGVR